jgi:hypothetical protein
MARIVVGVPGPWRERTDLLKALIPVGGGYLFAGLVFMEQGTGAMCEFAFVEHDPEMRDQVEAAGQGAFSPADLEAVAGHAFTAWLFFNDTGYEQARTAARFARVLLDAGGLAVKIDSSGLAHTRERWLRAWDDDDPWAVYSLFVVLVGIEGRFYSCGMHNFGLPDAAVPDDLGPEEGARLLNLFNVYRMAESPTLNSGETFSVDADSPHYRLTLEPYLDGYEDTPMLNPHGLWMLRPVAGEARTPPPAPKPERRRWLPPWR